MLRLSLEALQIVDAIDRRGSFSAAGKELHRVPSTISYTVGKLEDDLGVQVFERNGPRVELTRAGRELLKEGRYLLKAALDLEHRVRRVASGWETELALGIDSMFSAVAFDQDVRAFYEVAQQTRLVHALCARSAGSRHSPSGCGSVFPGREQVVVLEFMAVVHTLQRRHPPKSLIDISRTD